jgi:hypothetical protein
METDSHEYASICFIATGPRIDTWPERQTRVCDREEFVRVRVRGESEVRR